ncbi:DUF4326 domain-containing protein [Xanthobacter sp. DSM 14520]|uniref:DUF4326 domain-containing protein n=1 Tax=Xanthobacter autotrophicus (strain ATCC BAA-1158 / Py2) TaxID=78245 RepID=UPI00372BDAA0
MTRPARIQLQRRAGWRMPPNTVKVDRSTRLGNPFVIVLDTPDERAASVRRFAICMTQPATWLRHAVLASARGERAGEGYFLDIKTRLPDLRGRNLACWCRLCAEHLGGKPFGVSCTACAPCHADVLGELAHGLKCEALRGSEAA